MMTVRLSMSCSPDQMRQTSSGNNNLSDPLDLYAQRGWPRTLDSAALSCNAESQDRANSWSQAKPSLIPDVLRIRRRETRLPQEANFSPEGRKRSSVFSRISIPSVLLTKKIGSSSIVKITHLLNYVPMIWVQDTVFLIQGALYITLAADFEVSLLVYAYGIQDLFFAARADCWSLIQDRWVSRSISTHEASISVHLCSIRAPSPPTTVEC